MSEELDRLPPPAFPPGEHRRRIRAFSAPVERSTLAQSGDGRQAGATSGTSTLREADGWEESEGHLPEEALISPDAPLVPRVGPEPSPPFGPMEAAEALEEAARALRERGVAPLVTGSARVGFEEVILGFVAGYLARG